MDNLPKYWIACSGGVDSVVLAHLMAFQKQKFGILHCNFHLRNIDSDLDEKFVVQLAEKLQVPVQVKHFDTFQYQKEKNVNTELAARELRYKWFNSFIDKGKIILLAHHYDDQIETFFLQLRRGAKVHGLSCMTKYHNGFLRLLLNYPKSELITIATTNNWKWREDDTNKNNVYKRNFYRNTFLPFLRNNQFPIDDVAPTIKLFQQLLTYLKSIQLSNKIPVQRWKISPEWTKKSILTQMGLGNYKVSEIDKLIGAENGKFIGNNGVKIWKDADYLTIQSEAPVNQVKLLFQSVPASEVVYNSNDLFVDKSKIKGLLTSRLWKNGDKFSPLGMKGEKKVGKFLRDKKVPAYKKREVHVIVNQSDSIIGILGFCIDDNYKISSSTQEVLQIKWVT